RRRGAGEAGQVVAGREEDDPGRSPRASRPRGLARPPRVSLSGHWHGPAGGVRRSVPCTPSLYRPRDAEHTVLHAVIREHLETFVRGGTERGDGSGLPRFVEKEFREFLTCGILAHGFTRLKCDGCGLEHVLPFSCKGRGFCPSCGGRRMTERAAHLVD